uniref:Uncharacterized protein n=1 Tax=Oryza glumipatula TaxID=40148 RepID=A0A0E0AAF3_9ORYZ
MTEKLRPNTAFPHETPFPHTDKKVPMANLNSYHLATWADSAKTRNPTGPGSSHENMWLHFLDGKSHTSVSQGKGQGAAAPPQAWACPAMAAWRLRHSDVGGVLWQRRAAAATSSGVGKRRRRRIRWCSTELRDDVEMTHQRRAADAGVEERGKRRGRKRGSASGLYQRLRCGRKTVTMTARLPAATAHGGDGGGFGKKGEKGVVADGIYRGGSS